LVVTHDLPFALATCARSLVLDQGKIALDLATTTLLNDPDLLARHRLALPFGYRS
jgi:energy-coupling factor transporter ATP-binding protein EcfA2